MATYKPLQSVVLTSATSSVTFSGIDQSYSDLILTCNSKITTGTPTIRLQFNSDTGSNYSATMVYGDGSSPGSVRVSNEASINSGICVVEFGSNTIHINNYSNTTTYKNALCNYKGFSASYGEAGAKVGLWRNTAAISTIRIFPSTSTFEPGSTFSLYGIKSGAPQALGGDVVATDGTYWYHAFKTTGAFTPLKTLTADYLVVAGGGAGGNNASGGGGAGGLLYNSTTIQPNQTYTVTVGAGAANTTNYSSSGTNGNNSSLIGTGVSVTATGGGAGQGPNNTPAGNGGSGGGSAGYSGTPARGTGISGQGNNGGLNAAAAESSGGGGAGGVGGNGGNNSARTGVGGVGLYYDAFGSATGTGQYVNSHYYYAGGGGGGAGQTATSATAGGYGGGGNGAGSDQNPVATAGTANTGGGGGGTAYGNTSGSSNTAGGSGIVIVRYPV